LEKTIIIFKIPIVIDDNMQSKLSENQKNMLKYVYNSNSKTSEIFNRYKSYNSANKAMHELIKRKLLYKKNEGRYIKEVELTEEGQELVEKLLLINKAGFLIEKQEFKDILTKINKQKETIYLIFCIENSSLSIKQLDRKRNIIHKFRYKSDTFININGNNSQELDKTQVEALLDIVKRKNKNKKVKTYLFEINDVEITIKTNSQTNTKIGLSCM